MCPRSAFLSWEPGAGTVSGWRLRDGLREYRLGDRGPGIFDFDIRTAEGSSIFSWVKAAELVRLKVDIIVTFQTPPSTAAKLATSEIPYRHGRGGRSGWDRTTASLARPEAETAWQDCRLGPRELAGKDRGADPRRLASRAASLALANETDTFTKPFLGTNRPRACSSLGMEIQPIMVQPAEPLEAAFETMQDY